MSEEEGEFKKRSVYATWETFGDLASSKGIIYSSHKKFKGKVIPIEVIEDAKKEIFESMPKRTEMYMLNEKWVRIPFDEWQKLLTCWQTVEKWFGKLEVIE